MTDNSNINKGSFRDPSGFVYSHDGTIYRQINECYKKHYEFLLESGLYKTLVERRLLIDHEEVSTHESLPPDAHLVIRPRPIRFLSYPYEWSFSQLKDAALTTLEIEKAAIQYGMTLKDASAYNIQFHDGKPILIDTLSFETYHEGQTWTAYRQFCQHFLAPLALMSYCDIRLGRLLRLDIDGIPLDLADSLLPLKSRLSLSLMAHIHFHSRSQRRYSDKAITTVRRISKRSLLGLTDNLESVVKHLRYDPTDTEWSDYYDETNYSDNALQQKEMTVVDFVETVKPNEIWDLGSNTGRFSRLASSRGILTVSMDSDPAAVEKNYCECKRIGDTMCHPLLVDLTNPSPGIGWRNDERTALLERGKPDCVIALALLHHLAISNNLPLKSIAGFLASMCKHLIIEFVPKSDSQVTRLLRTREDIFDDYTEQGFEDAFAFFFSTIRKAQLDDSKRTIYLMSAIED